jgi:Domain of unknown function (DUF5666)
MFQRVILTCAFLFVTSAAFAHGTGQHVLGTVTAIDNAHLEIKTQKGTTVDVTITKQTRFKEKGNPKGTNLPSVGDRVVIEATKDNKILTATEVHFSAAKRVLPPMPVPVQPTPAPAR